MTLPTLADLIALGEHPEDAPKVLERMALAQPAPLNLPCELTGDGS
ncbi:hypothetical protein [Stutzerimonas kunmingensis]